MNSLVWTGEGVHYLKKKAKLRREQRLRQLLDVAVFP
jgi:hypothetical protein